MKILDVAGLALVSAAAFLAGVAVGLLVVGLSCLLLSHGMSRGRE